jgi:hypothetical protein
MRVRFQWVAEYRGGSRGAPARPWQPEKVAKRCPMPNFRVRQQF